jgi:hypothetical protein
MPHTLVNEEELRQALLALPDITVKQVGGCPAAVLLNTMPGC